MWGAHPQKLFQFCTGGYTPSMSLVRRSRTTTTPFEQSILLAHIERFFRLPARSESRSQIVLRVRGLLSVDGRQWTGRDVRLWFNNNRRHCLNGSPQLAKWRPPPPPRPFGAAIQQQSPVRCAPLKFEVSPPAQDGQPNLACLVTDERPRPAPIQYFPLPAFDPPRWRSFSQ
jgi:hypothetical protein